MKNRGFTLIELIISIAIAGIGCLFIVAIYQGNLDPSSGSMSFGINGTMETRCVDGYKFMIGQDGSVRQIMDELAHGVRCN